MRGRHEFTTVLKLYKNNFHIVEKICASNQQRVLISMHGTNRKTYDNVSMESWEGGQAQVKSINKKWPEGLFYFKCDIWFVRVKHKQHKQAEIC